jgi:hypothetical protein
MSLTGANVPGAENSTVVPNASPTAKPIRLPVKRSIFNVKTAPLPSPKIFLEAALGFESRPKPSGKSKRHRMIFKDIISIKKE